MDSQGEQEIVTVLELLQGIAAVLLFTVIAVKVLTPIAYRYGLVDKPNGRKDHEGSIPLVGGVALGIGMFVGMFVFFEPTSKLLIVLLSGAVLLLIGLLDDLRPLGVSVRVGAQVSTSLAVMSGTGLTIASFGDLNHSPLSLGYFAVPFTILAVIGLTNAFNLIDGIDGLAGSMALVAILGIFIFQLINDKFKTTTHLILLASALLPYLYFNLSSHSKIFLGDAGSTFIGFVLAWTLINLSQDGLRTISPGAALWCVALPVVDTLRVMLRRIFRGVSPFRADRSHLHHVLMRSGFSPRETLVLMTLLATFLLGVGVVFEYYASWLSAVAFIGAVPIQVLLIRNARALCLVYKGGGRAESLPDTRTQRITDRNS